ncbi:MAG: hypothetical protein HQ557_11420 [Bacteroidetes bacterium]|nr:hypothetical protein [Bacteroidota bacterium]
MLHDPSHQSVYPTAVEIILKESEKTILRQLAEKLGKYSQDPSNAERAILWQKMNDLQSERPMVWINEIPWHEMNYNDELTLKTEHSWARQHETELRRQIYQWEHLQGDMVLDNFITCPLAVYSSDFGIMEDVDIVKTDSDNEIYSRHFKIQIREPEDIAKIKMPKVLHNEQATEYALAAMQDLYRDIIPVKKVGQTHIWFTPWDYLIRWWGIQEAMMDLVLRPDMVNEAVSRMVDGWMTELDQFVEQNLLSLDCYNTRIGSGGYGYTQELPGHDFDPDYVKPHNMWGCSNAQIFSEVSPEMHGEFAIQHDLRWMARWGLTYYGCCEPLGKKIHLLEKIPNLRKISVSPWNDSRTVAENIGDRYVSSRKPNPAVLAPEVWSPEQAEAEMREYLDRAGDCHVEMIMKDISTVRYEPKRLWEWADTATRLAKEYSN